MEITVYKRHSSDCDHKEDRSYKRCECRVMLEWNDATKRHRKSAKTRSWTKAEQIARSMERDSHARSIGEQPKAGEPVSLEQAADMFRDKKAGRHKETRRKYTYTLANLKRCCERLGRYYVADITESDLQKYQASWTLKSTYAKRNEQERLRAFFRYCCASAEIRLAHNPTSQLEHFNVSDREPTAPLTGKEYENLLTAVSQVGFTPVFESRIHALILVMRNAGLSLQDAAILDRANVTPAKVNGKPCYRVIIRRSKTRTGVNNVIPKAIGDQLIKVMNSNPRHFFWSGNGEPVTIAKDLSARLKLVFDKAGIKNDGNMLSHRLRDTFAVSLLEKRIPLRVVSKALGHKNTVITERHYAKWTAEQQDQLEEHLSGAWKE
jgi:integrase/recombinase XerD